MSTVNAVVPLYPNCLSLALIPAFGRVTYWYNENIKHALPNISPVHPPVFWRWWPCVHIRMPWSTGVVERRKTRSSWHQNYCRTVHTGIHKCSCLQHGEHTFNDNIIDGVCHRPNTYGLKVVFCLDILLPSIIIIVQDYSQALNTYKCL